MPEVVAIPNEVLNILVLLSMLGITGIFMVKLYNVLHAGEKFSIQISTIFLAASVIAYLFIEVGLFLSIPLDVESTLLEYNFYMWYARVFLLMNFIFWLAELLFNAGKQVAEPFERMAKRRNERIKRYY